MLTLQGHVQGAGFFATPAFPFQEQQVYQDQNVQFLVPKITKKRILPYGETLHYLGCGCPLNWQHASRAADLIDSVVASSHRLYQQGMLTVNRRLKIAYMLPHHNITGGMKCLVEHIRLLRARGHHTIAVHRSASATRAMPPWTTQEADADVVLSLHQRLADVYPVQDIDVVVVGIFHQVAELLAGCPAPVLYWEQGHEWVFGDPIRLQVAQNYLRQDQLFHMTMHLPAALAGVSSAVQDILQQEFNREALLIPNGVDCDRFQPGQRNQPAPTQLQLSPSGTPVPVTKRTVLLVGNPALPLKGFNTAVSALALVAKAMPLAVRWVCQQLPSLATVPALATAGLDIEYVVSPSQELLPSLYQGHDVFLFTSQYEAWGMPVLEAMASGLAVVTTTCLGVDTFCRQAENCMMAGQDDVAGLASHVLQVLSDAGLRSRLQAAGRATALQYTPTRVVEQLEGVLYSLTACSGQLLQIRQAASSSIQLACAWAGQACSKTR